MLRFDRVLTLAARAAVLLVAALGGCSIKSANLVPIEDVESLGTGVLAVDVENVRGAVEVWSDPLLTSPQVEAVRIGDAPGDKPLTFVASQLVASDVGSVLRVVSADRADAMAPPMLLRVRVPSCDGLRIRNHGGTVFAKGVGGAITIEATGKDITTAGVTVAADRPITQPFSIQCESGDVLVTIPAQSEVSITAEASGSAKLLTNSARVVVRKISVHSAEATLGLGTAPLHIRADRGNVRIEVHDAPWTFKSSGWPSSATP